MASSRCVSLSSSWGVHPRIGPAYYSADYYNVREQYVNAKLLSCGALRISYGSPPCSSLQLSFPAPLYIARDHLDFKGWKISQALSHLGLIGCQLPPTWGYHHSQSVIGKAVHCCQGGPEKQPETETEMYWFISGDDILKWLSVICFPGTIFWRFIWLKVW